MQNKAIKLLNTKAGAVAVGIAGIALIGYYVQRQAAAALPEIGEAVNPVNDDNIFATGVNAIGAKLSGNEHWKLGSWIYDATH